MRDIKFRAWDKDAENMFIIFDANKQTEWFLPKWKDRYEVMQYTGLEDKNEVEIYEGDIVRVLNNNIGEYECGEVLMGGLGSWAIRLRSLKVPVFEFIDNRLSIVHSTERIEVIGNIYDNPELLGVK